MKRRNLLAAVPALAAATVSTTAKAAGRPALLDTYRQWAQARNDLTRAYEEPGGGNGDTPAALDAWDREDQHEMQIVHHIAEHPADLLCQLRFFLISYGPHCLGALRDDDDTAIVKNMIAATEAFTDPALAAQIREVAPDE